MRFPSKEIVERIRREYPAGVDLVRVELLRMDDPQAAANRHTGHCDGRG